MQLAPPPAAGPGGQPLHLADAQATRALGCQIAGHWLSQADKAPSLLLLKGDLGAGKTCLVQGLAEGLGIAEPITSPTFALAQHYVGMRAGRPTALIHLDLYRLNPGAAADELLCQEEEEALAAGALVAVEWPERLSAPLEDAWEVQLDLLPGQAPEAGRVAMLRIGAPQGAPQNGPEPWATT